MSLEVNRKDKTRKPRRAGTGLAAAAAITAAAGLFVAATVFLSGGCDNVPEDEADAPVRRAPPVGPLKALLVDGFEKRESSPWGCDAAEDEAELDFRSSAATQGRAALRLKLRPRKDRRRSGQKILLRRETSFSFAGARAVLLDVKDEVAGASVALALQCDTGNLFQESRPVSLKIGLNRDVRFPLDGPNWKSAASRWAFSGPPVNLDKVRRVFIIFFAPAAANGALYCDNLRLETPADTFYREWRPEILLTSPWEDTVQYRPLEKMVFFRASYSDVFDRRDIAVGAEIIAPSGRKLHVRGFFAGLTRGRPPATGDGSTGKPFWGPRFKKTSLQTGLAPKATPEKKTAAVKEKPPADGLGNLPPPPPPPPPPSSAFTHRKKGETEAGETGKTSSADKSKNRGKNNNNDDEQRPGDHGGKTAAAAVLSEKRTGATTTAATTARDARDAGGAVGAGGKQLLPVWLLRFTPEEVGRYSVHLYVRNRLGEARAPEEYFLVLPARDDRLPAGVRGGGVRVSRRDGRRFELQDGRPFIPLGQNVCWTKDWEPYLKKIAAYGGNLCRIWLCPWGLALENPKAPGTYNLVEADRLDRLVRLAERTGVRLIICFAYHGLGGAQWKNSPYASANGGPCARPEDFFTNADARAQFARLLRYAAARWGYSPAIFSWELFNEADLARCDRPSDVTDWLTDMAGRLKYADPHRRLVTFSVNHADFDPKLWQDPRFDFISVHCYDAKTAERIRRAWTTLRPVPKPLLIAEFGGHWEPETDTADVKGLRLKKILWLTACSPTAGVALPWWWDLQIEPNNLYGRFRAVSAFLRGEDRRGRFDTWMRRPLENGWLVSGIADREGARLFIRRSDHTADPTAAAPCPKQRLKLEELTDGAYRVEFWDAETGKVFHTEKVTAEKGVLSLELPARKDSFAVKTDRLRRSPPRLSVD